MEARFSPTACLFFPSRSTYPSMRLLPEIRSYTSPQTLYAPAVSTRNHNKRVVIVYQSQQQRDNRAVPGTVRNSDGHRRGGHHVGVERNQWAIVRTSQLEYTKAKSWVEEELQKLPRKGDWELMWVKGHDGMKENGEADRIGGSLDAEAWNRRSASNKPSPPEVGERLYGDSCTKPQTVAP